MEESKRKYFFKNQPKRTLPRPVISERRKIFENGWILPLWNSESVKSVFQTVDIFLANVLTSREPKFFQINFYVSVDFCPLKFRISESTWYRVNAVHRNLTFTNPVFCRKNVRCSVEGYQVFRRFCPLSSRGVLLKSLFRG